tara:strand:+ start:3039 stop:3749 length:711 start_codon:yes stop_codon:yes gene_type:complete
MAQSGIHAFSGIVVSKFLKNKKWFIPSFIFGSILPDIDVLFAAILFLFGTNIFDAEAIHRTFTHSLFTIVIIYFIFLSISEITSKQKFKVIGKGICLGMILHCILDIFLWFSSISLLWPIQPYLIQPIDIWGNMVFKNEQAIRKILLALEFIMFRFYGWFLINKAIQSIYIQNCIWFVKYISRWIKIEFIIFLFFLFLIYLNTNINSYKIFFTIMYIPSLIMALISTYILRDVLND